MSATFTEEKFADPNWAWAAYRSDARRPWDLRWAGHLYRRAAFGGSWDQLQTALADGPAVTVEKLLRPKGEVRAFNQAHDEYERAAAQSSNAGNAQAWWLRRLLESPYPLLEQMTLFWHNYFGISNARVGNPALMCRYAQLLRLHALGRFDVLLGEAIREPAILLCLESKANRKGQLSETFGRILLEQYTVGPGQFSGQDAHEAARGFTGWHVSAGEAHYVAHQHDAGPKKLLGEEGALEGDDVLRILLRQPATAQRLVRALYRWFISETTPLPENLVAPLAASFAKDFDTARLVETLLRSNLFFSPVAYRQKVKSPVEFAAGLIRPLKASVGTLQLGAELADLGQELYEPPTIKGWAGHRCWINAFTMVGRAKLAQALFSSSGPYGGKLEPTAGNSLGDLFLQGDLPVEVSRALAGEQANGPESLRRVAALMASLPEFQLA